MKLGERKKVEKVIQRIQSNAFDEIDIDTLFTKLREYAPTYSSFKEVSHYLAHNRERDQGITRDELSSFWLTIRFYKEYYETKRHIDIYNLPIWVKKFILFQAERLDNETLKSELGMSGRRLTDYIKSKFKDYKVEGITKYKKSSVSDKDVKIINYLLMKILVKPAFTMEEVFEELTAILEKLSFDFNTNLLSEQRDKISLCIMHMIDNTIFILSDGSKAKCNITSEKLPNTEENYLCMSGSMEFTFEESSGISFVLFNTKLKIEDWLDPMILKEQQKDFEKYQTVYLMNLYINSQFKLARHEE
uniref:hypothetical protein n=1 Tax=Psychrobacter sp. TaxID=56811 RepID=UPI0015977A14|nr:hypothetical protein [Psychrobacter sp.]QJS05439.1 hypothetical protein [Psychrobacter sp.]